MSRSGLFTLLILVGSCGALGYYAYTLRGDVSRLEAVENQLRSDLKAKVAEIERLAGDNAKKAAEIDGLKDDQTKKAAEVELLRSDLLKRQAAIDAMVTDLDVSRAEAAKLKGQLAEVGQAKAESEKRSSVVLDLQNRALALQKGIVDLRLLMDQVFASERLMRDSPDDAAFTQLRRNLSAVRDKARESKAIAEGLGRAIDQAGELQGEDRQSVAKAKQEVTAAIAAFQTAIDSTDRSIASLREAEHDVLASEGWQQTDARMQTGEVVCIRASGSWTWGRVVGNAPVGPQGVNADASYREYSRFPNAALLLRIRGLDEVFPGWQWVQPPRGGTIEFRINDNVVNDNRGSIKIKMWILRPVGTAASAP